MANVFISYSHSDIQWKDELDKHLAVVRRSELVDVWTDQDISVGEEWQSLVELRIATADLIILLVSASFLASDFINSPQLKKAILNSDKVVLPIILKSCDWQSVEVLRKRQVFPESGEPIHNFKDRDKIYSFLTNLISNWVGEIELRKKLPSHDYVPQDTKLNSDHGKKSIFISHCHEDGDFAELLKLRLEKENFKVWIDTDRLKIGQVWREEIDDAIRASSAFIVIMTPEARNSEYVTYEWAFAWGVKIKIHPIQLKKTTFHPRLETLQFLDFSNRESRPWDKLINELK